LRKLDVDNYLIRNSITSLIIKNMAFLLKQKGMKFSRALKKKAMVSSVFKVFDSTRITLFNTNFNI